MRGGVVADSGEGGEMALSPCTPSQAPSPDIVI